MKKTLVLILSLFAFNATFSQDTDSQENERDNNSRRKGIYEINFITSTLNENSRLNNLTGINDINLVNMGVEVVLGYSTSMGFEYTFTIGAEGWTNKTNNKQIVSLSGLYGANFGYRLALCKNEKFTITPRLGIGWNVNTLNYAEVSNRDIFYSELSQYSWQVNQYNNFYVPAALNLQYSPSKGFAILLGAEYRYFFYHGDMHVANTYQKVKDFPQFSANQLSFKLGIATSL